MKIAGVVKSSLVDYPGHISTVVFTQGCNMNCYYCHNKDLINLNLQQNINLQNLYNFLKIRKNFIEAVVISGGEPTLQEDIYDVLSSIKELGFKTKLDTNGTNPKVLKKLIDMNLLDYVAMDIKAPFEKYSHIVGIVDVENIKTSIAILLQNKVDYEFRTTFAPLLTEHDIENLAKQIEGANCFYLQRCNLGKTHFPSVEVAKKCSEIARKYVKNCFLRGFE